MHTTDNCTIEYDVPLAPHTTLSIGGRARFFCTARTIEEVRAAVRFAHAEGVPICVLGGGSNVLFSDDGFDGLVLHMALADVSYEALGNIVHVTVGGGVMLDALIETLVDRGLWGLENLSAIPGTVGATPVQNVGAYGVEVKDSIVHVTVYDMQNGAVQMLSNAECSFGYRDSLFKSDGGKRYIILSVTFALSPQPHPRIAYKDLAARFDANHPPTLRAIRETIIDVRRGKFPDWHVLGTAGSFFKNPRITEDHYRTLLNTYPALPGFSDGNGYVKVPLGWVLEHVLNKKGYRAGNVGLYEKQALVLVQYGGATAHEVMQFSQTIIDGVYEATYIRVEREVVCV